MQRNRAGETGVDHDGTVTCGGCVSVQARGRDESLCGPPIPAELGARKLSAGAIRRGFKPEALHTYTDANGTPVYWRIRLKHPISRDKWIRPMRVQGMVYDLAEPAFVHGKPLYRLHDLAPRPDETVIVTEGEYKADKLAELGLLVTTSGAANSAGGADWQPLAGRKVRIWPDHDEAGRRYAQSVAAVLMPLGCAVRIVEVGVLGLEAKGDAADWLIKHPRATAADVLALACEEPQGTESNAKASTPAKSETGAAGADDDESDKPTSQASALVAFVEDHCVLFHDQNSDVYAQDLTTLESRRLDARQFRDWLVASFYATTAKAPRDQSVREALSTLNGLGRFRGECLPVHVRVAQHEGAYYLDLAEPSQSRAVRIDAGRWEIVRDPSVRFVRPESMRPLPEPQRAATCRCCGAWSTCRRTRGCLSWLGSASACDQTPRFQCWN